MATITISPDYGYVIATAAGAILLSVWHGLRVGGFRRGAQVPYPNAYASAESIAAATPDLSQKKYLFNCAQRAHGNYLESLPGVLTMLVVGGVLYPRTAAVSGVGWIVSRIVYALGYTRTDMTNGKGRTAGSPHYIFQIALLGVTLKSALDLIAS